MTILMFIAWLFFAAAIYFLVLAVATMRQIEREIREIRNETTKDKK